MSSDGGLDPNLFAAGGYAVRIMDLSGGNGSEPVETIKGFRTLEHANGFARRYVRDSLERCRVAGMSPDEVINAWFAFGEDAEVVGGAEGAWRSAPELKSFAAEPLREGEERNWRALDPRRDEADEDGDED
jgi:hypothetical protein